MMTSIFLTSATGFLGSYLADYFLSQNFTLSILARAKNKLGARDRVLEALKLTDFNSRPCVNGFSVEEGDVTLPDLGISEKRIAEMRIDRVQELWHSAGSIDFSKHNKENTLAVNLGGIKNVLDFALKLGIPEVHYIGTAYSDGNSHVVTYDNDSSSLPAFNNPYEESKYLSEQWLLEWSKKHPEVEVFIYKPSIVVGDRARGKVFNLSGYYRYMGVFYRFRKLVDSGRQILPESNLRAGQEIDLPIIVPGHSETEINLVTVDYVMDILMNLRNNGVEGIYPIVNRTPPLYGELLKNSLKVFNITGVETISSNSELKNSGALKRVESLIARGMIDYLPYISRTYKWDMSATIEQLGRDYEEHPEFDLALVKILMDYAIQNNFDITV